ILVPNMSCPLSWGFLARAHVLARHQINMSYMTSNREGLKLHLGAADECGHANIYPVVIYCDSLNNRSNI
ncbi:MAG: hypothetical protein ACRD8Z_27180, partial [Nitrososphaeraceae archaeon]